MKCVEIWFLKIFFLLKNTKNRKNLKIQNKKL